MSTVEGEPGEANDLRKEFDSKRAKVGETRADRFIPTRVSPRSGTDSYTKRTTGLVLRGSILSSVAAVDPSAHHARWAFTPFRGILPPNYLKEIT